MGGGFLTRGVLIEDALGFEVLPGAAKLELGELLLLTQKGVFGAQGEAELHEPGADDGEQRDEGPGDQDVGSARAKIGGG